MSKLAKALTAAAGAGGEALYVEDVFSTYLYTGTGSNISIDNGIDLAGEGGMVWFKTRSTANGHNIYDTERGNGKLQYITTEPTYTNTSTPWNPTSTGFNTGRDYGGSETQSGSTTASWTFRKAEKFFDVVTYTGNGSVPRSIAHNLGSVPGFIAIKLTSGTDNWICRHRSAGDTPNDMTNYTTNSRLFLNLTNAASGSPNIKADASTFTVNHVGDLNTNSATYVAYLFAHDAGGFGDDGSESIIKCGSYTGVSTGVDVDLGFEPQWVLVKPSSIAGNWDMADVIRGATAEKTTTFNGSWAELTANTSAVEIGRDATITPRPTGMFIKDNGLNNNGETYIYIAIRRPMKTPESGTEVFAPVASRSSGANQATPLFNAGWPVDLMIQGFKSGSSINSQMFLPRLTNYILRSAKTDAETDGSSAYDFGGMLGVISVSGADNTSSTICGWNFRRAPGFFDVVAYTGTGANATRTHNLGVAPEFMIVKKRSATANWAVYHSALGAAGYILLNSTAASTTSSTFWQSTTPTATSFYTGTNGNVGDSGQTYIAYLFATLAGVSKVGSYTGTGSNVDVDCGFSAGARFILIKRTDSTGDWYVWDSARGIVAGNDPYLLLNSTAAEVTTTDYIDPLSSGFTVTSSAPAALNASGGSYIFLAIA